MKPSPDRTLDAVAALLLVLLGYSYTSRLRVSGDEPHYLVMAQSLWREHDLDLQDNYAREDWREYTPGPVAPHYGAPRADGRPFPAHSPGLPFLLAPVYALGGRRACAALLGLLAVLMAAEVRRMARSLAGERAAWFAWIVALGPPVLFFSFHVYTEVPAALALALALRLALEGGTSAGRGVAAALAASAMPFLHVKMIAAATVAGLFALARLRGAARMAFAATSALAAAAFFGHYLRVFGVASPLALYGGAPLAERGAPALAALGLLFDRSFGLLPYAPVFVLSLAGFLPLARRWRQTAPLLAALAAVVAPVLLWRMWWGGQSPPARFLVPAVPVLAVAAAFAVARGGLLARLRWPLASLGFALALFMAWNPGALLMLNRGDRPTRVWEALPAAISPGGVLPSLVAASPRDLWMAGVWLAVLFAVLALDAWSRRRLTPARG